MSRCDGVGTFKRSRCVTKCRAKTPARTLKAPASPDVTCDAWLDQLENPHLRWALLVHCHPSSCWATRCHRGLQSYSANASEGIALGRIVPLSCLYIASGIPRNASCKDKSLQNLGVPVRTCRLEERRNTHRDRRRLPNCLLNHQRRLLPLHNLGAGKLLRTAALP